jgi:hypothetical protein
MTETYTFSRALHLMRYGGKKMRCLFDARWIFEVVDGELYTFTEDSKQFPKKANLISKMIMGSWIEVKDA